MFDIGDKIETDLPRLKIIMSPLQRFLLDFELESNNKKFDNDYHIQFYNYEDGIVTTEPSNLDQYQILICTKQNEVKTKKFLWLIPISKKYIITYNVFAVINHKNSKNIINIEVYGTRAIKLLQSYSNWWTTKNEYNVKLNIAKVKDFKQIILTYKKNIFSNDKSLQDLTIIQ